MMVYIRFLGSFFGVLALYFLLLSSLAYSAKIPAILIDDENIRSVG